MLRGITCAVAVISAIFFASRQMLEKSAAASEVSRADGPGRTDAETVQFPSIDSASRAYRRQLRRIGTVASRMMEEFAVRQPRLRYYRARGTAYYPHHSKLEGGHNDRKGRELRTLQAYLEGQERVHYVSAAMDPDAFPYGTCLRILELEERYGKPIRVCVVDTGQAFFGAGTTRIDICVRSKRATHNRTINSVLTLVVEEDARRVAVANMQNGRGLF